MTTRYVEVPSEAMESFLTSNGFVRGVSGSEVTYERAHHRNPKLHVKVYTSIKVDSASARGVGQDAIRIVAYHDGTTKSFGVYKAMRVYRTGSVEKVLERTHARMREAYQACNDWLKKHS